MYSWTLEVSIVRLYPWDLSDRLGPDGSCFVVPCCGPCGSCSSVLPGFLGSLAASCGIAAVPILFLTQVMCPFGGVAVCDRGYALCTSLVTVDIVVQTADASKYGILFGCIFAAVHVYALMFVYAVWAIP